MKTGQIVCYKTGQIISSLQGHDGWLTSAREWNKFTAINLPNELTEGMDYAVSELTYLR
jgi:hypothetical protein